MGLEKDVDLGCALKGLGFVTPDLGNALQFFLDLVGNQFFHLLRGKARGDGINDSLANGEVRIKISRHGTVGVYAHDHDKDQGHPDDNRSLYADSCEKHDELRAPTELNKDSLLEPQNQSNMDTVKGKRQTA